MRPFNGLDKTRYSTEFNKLIDDPYIKKVAIDSLNSAGEDQKLLFDFSVPYFNSQTLNDHDVGFAYFLGDEVIKVISDPPSPFL